MEINIKFKDLFQIKKSYSIIENVISMTQLWQRAGGKNKITVCFNQENWRFEIIKLSVKLKDPYSRKTRTKRVEGKCWSRRDHRLLVSLLKDTGKCFEMAAGGLNPRPLDWQSGALPCDHCSPQAAASGIKPPYLQTYPRIPSVCTK